MTKMFLQGKPMFGYTDTETVKLDIDEMPFSEVKEIAIKTMKHFDLQGFMILKSSHKSYHVVFDQTVTWTDIDKIKQKILDETNE